MRTLCKWAEEVPNNGLIRYFGIFNREQVLVTRPQGCKEVLQTQGYNYIKFPWALEIMGQVTGTLGLLVAPPKKHKVSGIIQRAHIATNSSFQGRSQAHATRLQSPLHQKSLPYFLE